MAELLDAEDWAGKIYSGGWVAGSAGSYSAMEPATGRHLAEVGAAGPGDVRHAVALAHEAQHEWAATPYDQRAAVLHRAAELLHQHRAEMAEWVMREAGMPRYWAGVEGPAEEIRQAAALAAAPLGRVLPSSRRGCRSPAACRWAWSGSSHRSTLIHRAPARARGAAARRNPVDDDVAYGPLIDEAARDRVHGVGRASVDSGARLVTGGSYDRLFNRPTVLADVPLEAPAYQEEIFGPVAPVVTFKNIEEAARLAAGTRHGLSLAVLTKDVMKGLALADKVPVGMVHVNDQTSTDEPIAPFGGMGLSGNGFRIGGQEANLEAFTETQWITVNRNAA